MTQTVATTVSRYLWRHYPGAVLEAVGPSFNRGATLAAMPWDLPERDPVAFEDLAGLFASTSFDHGVITMTVRQAAYIYGWVQRTQPARVVEIGRYKGGSTVVLAAAMAGEGTLWSIDTGEKAARLGGEADAALAALAARHGWDVRVLVGDAHTVAVETGLVDLVLVDGAHDEASVRADVTRWGGRLRLGGALFLDDAHADRCGAVEPGVQTVMVDLLAQGRYICKRVVDRLVHLERIRL